MRVKLLRVSGFRDTWHLRTIPILPCAGEHSSFSFCMVRHDIEYRSTSSTDLAQQTGRGIARCNHDVVWDGESWNSKDGYLHDLFCCIVVPWRARNHKMSWNSLPNETEIRICIKRMAACTVRQSYRLNIWSKSEGVEWILPIEISLLVLWKTEFYCSRKIVWNPFVLLLHVQFSF
jgi:hypothetical protein